MKLTEFLKQIVEKEASDGFAAVGALPIFKVDGELLGYGDQLLGSDDVSSLIQDSMTPQQFEDYTLNHDANYAIEHPELGRFRQRLCAARAACFSSSSNSPRDTHV